MILYHISFVNAGAKLTLLIFCPVNGYLLQIMEIVLKKWVENKIGRFIIGLI